MKRGEIRWYTFRAPDNFDHVALAQKDRLGAVICTLPEARWAEIKNALLIACGFEIATAS